MKKLELGITSFLEVMENPKTKETISYDERIRHAVNEIVLADKVGLDFYGVGEHHRSDYAASSPHMILAAASRLTNHITLGSAVTVLSSEDPVRVYQNFATLNALTNGRAEIMVGRGSFIESFPLFGYDLNDYDELFDEKLNLLVDIRDNEFTSYQGNYRAKYKNLGVYPRTSDLRISVAVGGTMSSAVRAGKLGLPLFVAIIGGSPRMFKPMIDLYRKTYIESGHDISKMHVSVHSHGYIADTYEEAFKTYYSSMEQAMNRIGRERGWGNYNRRSYEFANQLDGALYVGDPEYVAQKIVHLKNLLDVDRFTLHVPVGFLEHEKVLKSIELLGTKVRSLVDQKLNENI